MSTLYHARKAHGVCVRCERAVTVGARGKPSVLCREHWLTQDAYHKHKKPDDALDAIISTREPPRAPYVAEGLTDLPELPTACPRCQAQLFPTEIEIWLEYKEAVFCIACGFRTDRYMLANRHEQGHERR